MADLEVLEGALGHRFTNRALLERALTHTSSAYERASALSAASDNEQLEFLGDAILGFVVSECLVKQFPDAEEGRLSKLKAHLVSASHLHSVAQELGLGEFLYLGRGEEMSGGRAKKTLLADALEALLAAMYLDGGMEPARAFIEQRVIGASDVSGADGNSSVHDFKSALQETAQTLGLPPPRYTTASEDGPEHAKTFTVEVRLGTSWTARAQGPSKKAAGQKAAEQILKAIAASKL